MGHMTTDTIERIRVTFSDGTTGEILPEGTRIRDRKRPELTGVIKHWEYNKPGILSPVPYCIGWDDSGLAHEVLGWFFVYASDFSVEAVPA
jgi:hypothetical protein